MPDIRIPRLPHWRQGPQALPTEEIPSQPPTPSREHPEPEAVSFQKKETDAVPPPPEADPCPHPRWTPVVTHDTAGQPAVGYQCTAPGCDATTDTTPEDAGPCQHTQLTPQIAYTEDDHPVIVHECAAPDCRDTFDSPADAARAARAATVANARWLRPAPDYWPKPATLANAVIPEGIRTVPTGISSGTRRALYSISAAGAGWGIGLGATLRDLLIDCGTEASIGAALIVGVGSCIVISVLWDARTRHWWGPLGWAARIPLATALSALALYTPAAY